MRELVFMGDSRRVLKGFPDEVRGDIGFALGRVQEGKSRTMPNHFGDIPESWKLSRRFKMILSVRFTH